MYWHNACRFNKIISETTDRAIAMIGINKDTVALPKKHVMNHRQIRKLIKLICVVYKEELCSSTADLQSVMNKPQK